jgi:UDP-glucose 4-epimerase
VYGHKSDRWPNEETATVPISSYGASKLASEAVLHAYEQYGIDVTIFRPANVVGPDQTHGVGYDFMRRLREDPTRLRILGDGKQSKQYLHVDDLLDAFEIAPPGTFNVASSSSLTVFDIAEMACFELGLQGVKFDVQGGKAWTGDIPVVRLECSKLQRLGWSARTSEQAMSQALGAL